MIKQVTWIGLGSMGTGIAQSFLKAGFDPTVFNRNLAKSEALAKSGAHMARSPREAVQNAEIVIGIVADDLASYEIWLGPRLAGKLGYDETEFSAIFEALRS